MITRMVNTLKDAAKVILEEQKNGLYPVEFSLPKITFSDNGERAELSPHLQAIIESTMNGLASEKSRTLKLSLKGLISVAEGKPNPETGDDLKVRIDPVGEISYVLFSEDLDVSNLSYHDLLKLRKIIDSCYPRDSKWKLAKFLTLSRIKKLKGENL
jgi:hypothetical protein